MATEATFTVPSDQFPLGSVFGDLPDVRVELERIIPGRDVIVPYVWVRGTETEDVEAAFDGHPGVVGISLVDSVEDQYLLRVEWAADYDGVLSVLAETGIPLITAEGTSEHWTFDIRADEHRDIASFQSHCRELDVPITLTELHALTPIQSGTEKVLTERQQEALVLAYDRGYFNSPRDVTLAELGDELGITQQAVASRLRRGIKHVLGSTLSEVRSSSGST